MFPLYCRLLQPILDKCLIAFFPPPTLQVCILNFKSSIVSQSWWIAGLGVVSGLVTRGKRACNVCADNLTCIVSSYLKKTIYPSFRQFLPLAHKWRKLCFKRKFGGHLNNNPIPVRPDGRYWIRRWKQIRETNMPKDRRRMKRLSALFTLPYWKVFI